VRGERAADRRLAQAAALVSTACAAALGALAAGAPGAGVGLAAGGALGLGLVRASRRRSERRRAVLAAPFPARWRELLLERYDHYERLDASWRARFEDDVRLFLAEKRVTGIEVEVTDELRLLVAASAVTLSLGWPDYEWDRLAEVLLYPDDFDRDFDFEASELAGQAHPEGTVILSAPSLEESFDVPDDAYHVGLHEFAHLLDLEQTHFGGVPGGLTGAAAREWVAVAEREMARMREGHPSAFDDYGSRDIVEFLGVAVEAFFEVPQRVRRRHAEVYRLLAAYFRQDPAAWDDARGLED
jgi:Mlc titration factor MtfA (ptsG expression regulator)